MSPGQPSAEELQEQMRLVRSEIDSDVRELVVDAQSLVDRARGLADWKLYVRRFPWTCLGLAGVTGYWLIPHRPSTTEVDPQELARLMKAKNLTLTVGPGAQTAEAASKFGQSRLLAPILNLAAGMLVQRGISLLESQVRMIFDPDASRRSDQRLVPENGHD